MSALYWLLIPVAATLVAVLLTAWLGRSRRPAEKYEQIDMFQRFCEAMEDEVAKRRSTEGDAKPITRAVE